MYGAGFGTMFPLRVFAASIIGGVLIAFLMPEMPLARQLPSLLRP